jgi:hypothetical protein
MNVLLSPLQDVLVWCALVLGVANVFSQITQQADTFLCNPLKSCIDVARSERSGEHESVILEWRAGAARLEYRQPVSVWVDGRLLQQRYV